MADKPKPPTDATAETKATPQDTEAAGAKAKLEADATPAAASTTTTTDSTSGNGTGTGGTTSTDAAAATTKPEATEKPEGEQEAAEPSLYERTIGKVDSIAEIKNLFGFGTKATSADLAKLPAVQVEGAEAEKAAEATRVAAATPGDAPDTGEAPKEGEAPTISGRVGAALGVMADIGRWGVKAITNPIETACYVGGALKDGFDYGFDWMTDWYGSNDDVLKNPDTAKQASTDFATTLENQVLSKGETTDQAKAETTINSKLPSGTTVKDVNDMLNYGLPGDSVDFRYNSDTDTYTEFDKEKHMRRVENADGSTTLMLSNGTRVNRDAQGNVTYLFNDGAVRAGADGSYTQSVGDWQKGVIAASEPLRKEIRDVVRQSERGDSKIFGTEVSAADAQGYMDRLLGGKTYNGEQVTSDQVQEFLKSGLPGADTQTLTTDGPDNGNKVQEMGGIKRIEGPDGTVTLQFPDGSTVIKNDKGTTYQKKGDNGKQEVLVESADGKHFSFASGDLTVKALENLRQRVNSEQNKKVVEIIQDRYAELIAGGKTHEEAMADLAKEQIIGGARNDSEVDDGQRRAGFLQEIDGKWYQVNSNGKEIHLREVTKGPDGALEFGDQFTYDAATGQWIGTDGKPYGGTSPKFATGPDGQLKIGEDGSLTINRDGDKLTVSGLLHTLTANGDGTSQFDSNDKGSGEAIIASVTDEVKGDFIQGGQTVDHVEIKRDGTFDGKLLDKKPGDEYVSDQGIIKADGTVVVPGLGGMTFKPNGDILDSNGEKLFDGATGEWSEGCGVTSANRTAEIQARENNAKASSEGAKAARIGAMVLSMMFAGPAAANLMRSLAITADCVLKGAESMASSSLNLSSLGSSIQLSSYRGAVNEALVASNRSSAAVSLLGPDLSAYQLGTAIAEITGSIGKTPAVMVNFGEQPKAAA